VSVRLAFVLFDSGWLSAAEEPASRAIDLFLNQGSNLGSAMSPSLGDYIDTAQEREGRRPFSSSPRLATHSTGAIQLFLIRECLVWLFLNEGRFDDAQSHIEHAKSITIDNEYFLGRATELRLACG